MKINFRFVVLATIETFKLIALVIVTALVVLGVVNVTEFLSHNPDVAFRMFSVIAVVGVSAILAGIGFEIASNKTK